MKICVVGDVHWSQYSSILRKRGSKYSYRLENLISSIDWVENLAEESSCDLIVYLGDFFDRADMNAEEITALTSISWANNIDHVFLVGNHETGSANLQFNSADVFDIHDNFYVLNKASQEVKDRCQLVYIPYILECDRKPLSEYYNLVDNVDKIIMFSHNDIKDFQMGQFVSKDGFSVDEIEANCDLYLNGHLHNGGKVTDKIINVGNLTGQNFSEDGFKYDHSVIILDTDDMSKAVYRNPKALNFIKLDFSSPHNSIDYINDIAFKMPGNCVATIKCEEADYEYLKARFQPGCSRSNIPVDCRMVETRFIINPKQHSNLTSAQPETLAVDHLTRFKEYMIDALGNTDVVQSELYEVCK